MLSLTMISHFLQQQVVVAMVPAQKLEFPVLLFSFFPTEFYSGRHIIAILTNYI